MSLLNAWVRVRSFPQLCASASFACDDGGVEKEEVNERASELHTFRSSGPGPGPASDRWRVWCETCGWELSGTGATHERDVVARSHRCRPQTAEADHARRRDRGTLG